MGNQCSKIFLATSKHSHNSLPSLLSYKRNDSLPIQLQRKKTVEINVNDIIHPSIEPVKQEPPSDRLYPKSPISENYILVWLTSNLNEDENDIKQIKCIVNSFRLFNDIDEFFAFIIEIKDEKIFLIISDILAQKILSFIHQTSQLIEIYIISYENSIDQQWIEQYTKIQGIFNNIESICEKIKQKIHLSENDILPIEIINSSSIIIQYFIKQILVYEINYHEKSKNDFITFAREQYSDELDIINEFEESYTPATAISWYTRKCFVYTAMNKAFRTENIELLIKMGFFIRDLHQQINQKQDPTIVYRGQGISENELEVLKNSKNGILSFKNFLWTNTHREISLSLSHIARNNPNLLGILFQIDINSPLPSVSLSDHEILFPIYSLFRINEIKQIENNIWQINLILINPDDQQLKDYFKTIKHIEGETAWQKLGFYFIQLNQITKAEQFYKTLIESNVFNNYPESLALINEQLGFIYHKKTDSINSLVYYEKSLKNYLNFVSQTDSILYPIYLNIGILLHQQNNFNEAIKYLKCALNIAVHSSEIDHLEIANLHRRIAEIYEKDGIFIDSIQNYQSALESELNHFPIHHVSIAKSYNKIGEIFYQMEDYTSAYSYYDKTLEIQKKSLSPNHSILAVTNYNIAKVLTGLQQYKEAIEYASRALNIARHSFGSNHEDVRLYEDYLKKLRRKTLIGVIPNGAVYE